MRRVSSRLSSCFSPRSFVAETLQRLPESCFIDILHQWRSLYLTAAPFDAYDEGMEAVTNDTIRVYDAAEVQLLNKLYEEPISAHMQRFLQHYSTAHFAAEVGSTLLLDLLSSQGVVVLRADSHGNCHHSRVPLMSVVLSLPDAEGLYLSHLAAKHGHLDFLRNMIERFGVESVLSQRTAVSTRRCWNTSTSVYGVAFVYGQVPVLEWVDTFHSAFGFTPIGDDAMPCTQLAAAHGQVKPLHYFLHRHGSVFHNVFSRALYPAAEAGSENVLNLVVDAIGEDVVWLPNDDGSTALHHAARLGRTELLLGFFQRYSAKEHLDDRDNSGRSPAMWCVLGGKKARNVAFLRILLRLGSQWPLHTDNEGRDMHALARLCYSPTTRMSKFITECIASAHRGE